MKTIQMFVCAVALSLAPTLASAQLSSTPYFDYQREAYRQQQLQIQQQILQQQRQQQWQQEQYNQQQLQLQRQMLNEQRQQTNEMRIQPYLYPQPVQPYNLQNYYGR